MNCLSEERFVELLEGGGLDAVSLDEGTHLRDCEGCRESWSTVAAAGAVLAEARPRGAGRVVRAIPLVAAAAVLLTIIAVIALRQSPPKGTTPVKDPVTLFLEGNPDEVRSAREALLKGGRKSMSALVASRAKVRDSHRLQALQELLWAIKRGGVQDPADQAIARSLETIKVDMAFEDSKVEDMLAFIRDFSRLNLVLDPSLPDVGTVKVFKVKDASLWSTLDTLCAVKDLDFDLRYGVVFLGKPMRLWSTDPQVGLPATIRWSNPAPQTQEESATMQKLRTIKVTLDMINAPTSAVTEYLHEVSGVPFRAEIPIDIRPLTIKVQDLALEHFLGLMSLPFGSDVRIEGGTIVIFDPHPKPRAPTEGRK